MALIPIPKESLSTDHLIEIVRLSGVIELLEDINNEESSYMTFYKDDEDEDIFAISIECALFPYLEIKINYKDKLVYIEEVITKDESNVGCIVEMLKSQSKEAIILGYSDISLYAGVTREFHHPRTDEKYTVNDYDRWGKYGFIMRELSDVLSFRSLMASKNCSGFLAIHTIYQDKVNAQIARNVWKKHGFSWEGKFNLKEEDSFSLETLNAINY